MKRVVCVLLTLCMVFSIMSVGAVAYATDDLTVTDGVESELPVSDETVVSEGTDEPQNTDSGAEEPQETQQPEETAAPSAEPVETQADEGFFADVSDDLISYYNGQLSKLGYQQYDRAGLYALCLSKGFADVSSFELWLDEAVELEENAEVSVNGVKYATIDDALALFDTTRSLTVKLEKNVTVEGLIVPAEKELLLDLNDYTLTLAAYQDGTASYFTVSEEAQDTDVEGVVTYVHAKVSIKNGTISGCANIGDGMAIYNAGTLTLSNVAVIGHVFLECEDADFTPSLTIQPDEFGSTSLFAGEILGTEGRYSVNITGGDFTTDISKYVDTTLYKVEHNEETGRYTVKGINDNTQTQSSTENTDSTSTAALPTLTIIENKDSVTPENGEYLDNSAVSLSGLKLALADNAEEMILRAYEGTSEENLMLTSEENESESAEFVSTLPDGTELTLTVKAELADTDTGMVSYNIKPCAVINGKEIIIDNAWLNGSAIKLSFYTGFLPEEIIHTHDNGTEEKIASDQFTYNSSTGMVTLNVTEFSTFTATSNETAAATTGVQSLIDAAKDGATVTVTTSETILQTVTVKDKSITLDLAGFDLTVNGSFPEFTVENGTLTIVGKGELEAGTNAIAELKNGGKIILGYAQPTEASITGTDIGYYTSSAETKFINGDSSNVIIRRSKLNFDPTAYVDTSVYNIAHNGTTITPIVEPTEWVVTLKYVAKNITKATSYETLREAIAKASSGNIIQLLADINEGNLEITKSLTIETLATDSVNYNITGNITVPGSDAVDLTLRRIGSIDGKVSVSDKTAESKLTLNQCDVTGGIEVGDNVSLTMVNCTVSGNIVSTGSSSTSMSLSDVEVYEADNTTLGSITADDNTSLILCNDVAANSLTIGDDTLATPASLANITSSSINNITLGSHLKAVSIQGVDSDNVTIGDNISGEILINSDVIFGGTNIGTLTIGENDTNVDIKPGTVEKPTKIDKLIVGKGSDVDLGGLITGLISNDTTDQRLVVNTVDSSYGGKVTIYMGTYDKLIGDGTTNSIVLYGGNYTYDYTCYCSCSKDLDGIHYTHYACNLVTDESSINYGRYRVGVFDPRITSPVSGRAEINRGYTGTLTYITNVPYEHNHTGKAPQLIEVMVDRGTLSQDITPADYEVLNYNGYLGIRLNGSYLSQLASGTYYIKIDTEVGTAYRQSDNSLAGFRVKLTGSSSSTSSTTRRGVQTGDDANLAALAGIMVLTGATAAAGVVVLKKKKQR